MDWNLVLQIVQTLAIIVGLVFGLDQLRQLRRQRDVQVGVELLRPLQRPEMAEVILRLYRLPDGLSEVQLRKELGADFGKTLSLLAMFESLGPLVSDGHVPLDMYAQSYRGPTIIAWHRLQRYIMDERAKGWTSLFEWLQWLAERLEEREQAEPEAPAFQRRPAP